MSGRQTSHDRDRRHLLRDLRLYLEQRQEEGWQWYLDAGPVNTGSPLAPKSRQTRKSTSTEASPPVGRPHPERSRPAAPSPAADQQTAGQDDFTRLCETFVTEALLRLEKSRPEVAQADIFSVPGGEARPLDPAAKLAALADLAAEVAPCHLCKLHGGRTQTVFGVGHTDADLVFIGEAPGRDEDRLGEPFVGRAGKLLNEILKAIGFRREDVYICNILKCRPPDNRDPEREEVDACEPYLKRQLEIIAPKVICCLGRVAAQTLLGTRASLTAMRETVHFYEGIPVVVTFHPAALLRNPHWKRPTWDDVRKLRALHDALQR